MMFASFQRFIVMYDSLHSVQYEVQFTSWHTYNFVMEIVLIRKKRKRRNKTPAGMEKR